MTALPASRPTHAEIVMEMLSAASRFGAPGVSIDDMAARLYPDVRPAHYAASIRSTIGHLRRLLAERDAGIACDGTLYALALQLPGVFRRSAGFVRRGPARRRASVAPQARFVTTATRRAGR